MEYFCNPVPFQDGKRHTNPDPFVLRWCGKWYCYATDQMGVKVSVSKDLVHWSYEGYAIQDSAYKDYWAPSVLYQNGTFYMYYSNIPVSTDDNHEEHLHLAVSNNPTGPFQWKKTFFEEFSIDSHPVMWNGRLYLFYSVNNWLGTEDKVAGTCILVDELVTPYELAGHPKPVVLPGIPQEIYAANRFGDGRDWYTIEGAAPVIHGDRFWLLYSANAYLNEDYFIGTAVARHKYDLLEMRWEKYPDRYTWKPLLKKSSQVEGTGHNTATKAPNMVDDWIVYHGRRMDEVRDPAIEQREMYIDPLWFNGRELLCFGPTSKSQEAPAQPQLQVWERDIQERTLFPTEGPFFYAELWVSAQRQHCGVRFGIDLGWRDERNYLELQLHSGRQELRLICCQDGISRCVQSAPLEKGFDYTVPHLFSISRCFDEYHVSLDGGDPLCVCGVGGGDLGIAPCFSQVKLHSLTVTETAELRGKGLRHLSRFYNVTPGSVDDTGFEGREGCAVLSAQVHGENFIEEFQLEACGPENEMVWRRDGLDPLMARDRSGTYGIYHIVRDGQEQFIWDGSQTVRRSLKDAADSWNLELKNVKITAYRFTKN